MSINFNAEPYYDDYNEDNNFYRVLFRPGYAVQARELTQLQTILQKQVTRHGDFVFKDGSRVTGGETSVDRSVGYVKLQNSFNNIPVASFLTDLAGIVIEGQTTGLRALILQVAVAEQTDPNTLFVKYLNSGTNGEKVFDEDEILQPEPIDKQSLTVQVASVDATGIGSVASIKRGIYYALGHFVLVEDQVLVLNKFDNEPTFRIGLEIVEELTTPEDNNTLLDNAQGSFNYAAPGAHRYKIDLILAKRASNAIDDENFIEIITVRNGEILRRGDDTKLGELDRILATRTYDESGDYVVKNFNLDVREHRNNDRGLWAASTPYLVNDVVLRNGIYYTAKTTGTSGNTAPTHTVGEATDGVGGVTWVATRIPFFNRGVYKSEEGGDINKLALGLEPGKAYVRGYQIEKISTEFIDVPKARDFTQAVNNKITATVGNYIEVTRLNNVPNINSLVTVDLYDQLTSNKGVAAGSKVGTARIRGIEWHNGTIGQDSAIYKLFLFDVKMNAGKDFITNVKQVFLSGGTVATSFSADVNTTPIIFDALGLATTSGSSTTVSGTNTTFTDYLAVGDYVRFGTGASAPIRRVTAVNNLSQITVDSAVNLTSPGSAIFKLLTQVYEPQNSPLVFTFPYAAIKSVRDASNINRVSYTVSERFTQNTTTGSGGTCTLTITATGANDTFASFADSDNYLLIDNTTGSAVLPSNTQYVSGSNNRQVIFTLPDTFASRAFVVIAAVNKSGSGTEKTKSLVTTNITVTNKSSAENKRITLGKADGYMLLSVLMDSGSFSSPTGSYTVDITDRYLFDDGQKDSYYDLCSIILREGQSLPTAPIRVHFQFFSHSGPGDYFTVNSYTGTIPYENIPFFGRVRLTDVIDFRPRIDDAGTSFTGSGSLGSSIPKRGIDVEADFSYFLGRKDKLALDMNGKFFTVSGVSALTPGEPNDPSVGMLLYKLELAAYTFGADKGSVFVDPIDNKRYTMRDIGKLEKRIDNLEYYTSLSLLEQETKSLTILDSETQLDRLKNGFVVDSFTGHGVGNTFSDEYRCSVDMQNGVLRPFFYMNNVNLIEVNKTDAERAADGYRTTGDLITLPYTNREFITQPFASRIENINPFAIFTFLGQIDLNPSSDEWFEVDRRPDVVTNVEGNFDTISTIAERAGVLGTVWNAWQTQWTGTPVSQGIGTFTADRRFGDRGAWLDATFGIGPAASGWAFRRVVAETFAQEIGQSRSGVKTTVVAKIDRQVTEDRILSTAVIPYIRSRNLLVVARGLKPNTTFNPFFDDNDVKPFTTPASRIQFTPVTGFSASFNFSTNSGGNAEENARKINGDVDTSLNRGDVIFVKQRGSTIYTKDNSPATAVVALQESIDGTQAVYVVNVNGTFQASDVLEGTISSARGTLTNITVGTQGSQLKSSAIGDVVCLFNIPNNESVRFRTGVREFKLTDAATATGQFTSRGRKQYRAEGILETRQANVTATRNAELVREIVTDERVVTQTISRIVSDTGWYDPLAQTFMVQQKGGAFLTKIDIFFATKDTSIPVQLEIREVVNGYPGKIVLPFSRMIVTPDRVNISTDTVNVDGVSIPAPNVPTSFVFPSPVYVQDATEYAIVLSSDSNNYKVWISQVGEKNAGTDRFISEQPYAGVFFKSQNASTWTADQTQDLKFTIWRASFETGQFRDVEFVNDTIPAVVLEKDPFRTVSGTNRVRVSHRNHGMPENSRVTISGVTSSINGIPAANFNATHIISNVEFDSYVITVTTNANFSGIGGGSNVRATENYAYSSIQPIVQNQNFSDTSLSYFCKTTSHQSVDGVETPYIQEIQYQPVLANDNNEYSNSRLVASSVNEANSALGGNKSLFFKARIKSDNEAVSPVIDTHRLSAALIRNKVDIPSASNNVAVLDTRTVITANNITATASTKRFASANTTTQQAFATVTIGKVITTSGFSNAANNGTFLVTDVAADGSFIEVDGTLVDAATGTNVTFTIGDNFVSEINPNSGSASSKYLTKDVILSNPSTFLKIRFAADVPPNADVDVYYKLSPASSSNTLIDDKYTLLRPDSPLVKNNDGRFYDAEYTLSNQVTFDAFVVKLVFKTTNEAEVAKIKDLRIIACA
jgi:hypothetical protein